MGNALTIVVPTRPQADTLVAIFLLQTFGSEQYPGIATSSVRVEPLYVSNSFEDSLAAGVLPLDVGGGKLDHHGKDTNVSDLVATELGIKGNKAIAKLLAWAKRDDQEGKGTLSTDSLDRAFGLSGLISSLNKRHPNDPSFVIRAVMPLIEAHYHSAHEHSYELPEDVQRKKISGDYVETVVKQGLKTLKVAAVVSDKSSMPTYLRSYGGGQKDVVLIRAEQGTRTSVITRQDQHVNLSIVAGLIRLREAELRGVMLPDDDQYVLQTGKITELPFWYVDPATNSILNVGTQGKDDTLIPWNEIQVLVQRGLQMATPHSTK